MIEFFTWVYHTAIAALSITIDDKGITISSIVGSAIFLFYPFVITWKKSGRQAAIEYWNIENGGEKFKRFLLILLYWFAIFSVNAVHVAYAEHVKEQQSLAVLQSRLRGGGDLFKDPVIEWDGVRDVKFSAVALRSADGVGVYLDLLQGGMLGFGGQPVFEGDLSAQPRIQIGSVAHVVRGQRFTVTLARVSSPDGVQMQFQWGDSTYQNYGVGVNYSGYLGRIVISDRSANEYDAYFSVVGRSFYDGQANKNRLGPALILGPSVFQRVTDWGN